MTFALAVDNWSSTVGTAHTVGSGQIVLASANGLPTLPPRRIYRITALQNPGAANETVLSIFEATGLSNATLTGVTAAAGYTDVALAVGVGMEIRVCSATVDELQTAIEAGVSKASYTQTWDWTTSLTDAATAADVGINAATWAAATQVNLSQTCLNGSDVSAFFAKFQVGDQIYLQVTTDSTTWAKYSLTALPTDQGTWWSWPVSYLSSNGVPPAKNTDMTVTFLTQGPAPAMAIGGPIMGSEPVQVLYADSGGNLAQSANLTFDGSLLTLASTGNNYCLQFGALGGIQYYAANNWWISDNQYYDGSNWRYRDNGYANVAYFFNGQFQVGTAPSNTAGADAILVYHLQFAVTDNGIVVAGGTGNGSGGIGLASGDANTAPDVQLTRANPAVLGIGNGGIGTITGGYQGANLSASTNDWNPGPALAIALLPTIALNITGMQAGANGQVTLLCNLNPSAVTLTNQTSPPSSGSAAANRWQCANNQDIILNEYEHALTIYSGYLQKWLVAKLGNTVGATPTAGRPPAPVAGQQWYDTTLSKPIWWTGSAWHDAAGNVV